MGSGWRSAPSPPARPEVTGGGRPRGAAGHLAGQAAQKAAPAVAPHPRPSTPITEEVKLKSQHAKKSTGLEESGFEKRDIALLLGKM